MTSNPSWQLLLLLPQLRRQLVTMTVAAVAADIKPQPTPPPHTTPRLSCTQLRLKLLLLPQLTLNHMLLGSEQDNWLTLYTPHQG